MYNIGDKIVYGKSGVCEVKDICEVPFGIEGPCYKLKPLNDSANNNIYISVNNDKVLMRDVISSDKAKEIVKNIDSYPAVFIKEDKKRQEMVHEVLNSDDMGKWIGLLKGLYSEKERRFKYNKTLKYKDEKTFEFLEDFIFGELAVALNIKKDDVYDYIMTNKE